MKRKSVLMAVLAFLFSAIFAMQAVPSVQAQTDTTSTWEPEDSSPPAYFVDANGTYFEITNSSYLNVTLTSSEYVHVFLESVPRMVSCGIESLSSATSTVFTFSGFTPNTTYYRYQDGNLTESFMTDSVGSYSYVQEITSPHHIFIVENTTTVYIRPDGTVYSDTGQPVAISISVVDGVYTYTFTDNIAETIMVQRDNIIIDGNGYTLQGPGDSTWRVGLYLSGRRNVTIKNTVIKGWYYVGIQLMDQSNYNTLAANTFSNNNRGIFLSRSSGNTVIGNTISNSSSEGIEFWLDSNSNTISGNTVSNNQYGIHIDLSSGNTLDGNTVTSNLFGIYIYRSSNNILRNNNMTENLYNFGLYFSTPHEYPDPLSHFIHDIDASNTVDGKPIYYWVNHQNKQVPANAGYVAIVNSTGVIVKDSSLTKNLQGVLFAYTTDSIVMNVNTSENYRGVVFLSTTDSSIKGLYSDTDGFAISLKNSEGNTLSGNTVSSSRFGINLYYSEGNTISGNTVSNNQYGMQCWYSKNATIYHNNFIDNTYQVRSFYSTDTWDAGYPSGGNYWSDYAGVDEYSGANQDEPGGDGIGDTPYVIAANNIDHYPFMRENGWKIIQYQITFDHSGVGPDFTGTVVIIDCTDYGVGDLPVSFSWDEGSNHTFAFQSLLVATPNATQHLWNSTAGLSAQQNETITASASGSIIGNYKTQHYLTVTSPFDTPGGEGWYDEGETAYAILAIGLEYIDSLAYGFVGWSGDATGLDLLSDPIIMNAPKNAIANWESSAVYGDVKTIGFWKHQVNVWYFTGLKNNGMKIRGIGTAQVSEDELMTFLKFISDNSGYTKFQGIWVEGNKLATLENAYDILKTPNGPDSIKMRAEQQMLAVWLNLAYKAFLWNTELSQDTVYVYYQYTFDEFDGLATIGEAIKFCEAELLNNGNSEAVKDICDSINNNLGIIWGT